MGTSPCVAGSNRARPVKRDPGRGSPSFGVELRPVGVRDAGEIERTIAAIARSSNAGMIVTASTSALIHRHLIVMLAARHGLPAVYPYRYFATTGGLTSYGVNPMDMYRRE